jgi:hypothetical protein
MLLSVMFMSAVSVAALVFSFTFLYIHLLCRNSKATVFMLCDFIFRYLAVDIPTNIKSFPSSQLVIKCI